MWTGSSRSRKGPIGWRMGEGGRLGGVPGKAITKLRVP